MKSEISGKNSEEIRIRAVIELGKDKSQASKELLIQTLSTLNSFVRDAVVQSLIEIGDIDFLCKNIEQEHRYVRRGIVQTLGNLGGKKACEALILCLNDREWGVRMYAAESLGKVGDKSHITDLDKLLSDGHEWPREVARLSIAKLN
jgi:HEAT repeat protein